MVCNALAIISSRRILRELPLLLYVYVFCWKDVLDDEKLEGRSFVQARHVRPPISEGHFDSICEGRYHIYHMDP